MDDVITTIVYLIPIAAILFIRIFVAKKRAQASKEKKPLAAEAFQRIMERSRSAKESERNVKPLSSVSGRETEEEWKPHWIEEEEKAGPRDDKAVERPVPAGSVPGLPRSTVPAGNARWEIGSSEPPLAQPPEANHAVPRKETPGEATIAEASPRTTVTRGTFPASVEGLSPLKKALVLSEVLGKPRAFEEGDRRF